MNDMAIQALGVRKSFGKQVVLSGLDLEVERGSVFALLGPNGAGKTTFIHILATLSVPDGGSVRIAGYDVVREKHKVKRSISLTGQYAAVDEMLTGEENLKMVGRLSGLTGRESRRRADELLQYFDLTDAARKRVRTYSGGMRRRLDLAISLVVSRPILFLDEPTTGLDTRSRRALWDNILQLKQQGITIFLTTQYLEEADQLADQVAVIHKGRVAAFGTPAQLKAQTGGEVIEFRNREDEIIDHIHTSGRLQDISRVLHERGDKLPEETKMTIRRPSMDDVFLALTADDKEMKG